MWYLLSFLLEIDVWLMGSSSPLGCLNFPSPLGCLVFLVRSNNKNRTSEKKTIQQSCWLGFRVNQFEIVCVLLWLLFEAHSWLIVGDVLFFCCCCWLLNRTRKEKTNKHSCWLGIRVNQFKIVWCFTVVVVWSAFLIVGIYILFFLIWLIVDGRRYLYCSNVQTLLSIIELNTKRKNK